MTVVARAVSITRRSECGGERSRQVGLGRRVRRLPGEGNGVRHRLLMSRDGESRHCYLSGRSVRRDGRGVSHGLTGSSARHKDRERVVVLGLVDCAETAMRGRCSSDVHTGRWREVRDRRRQEAGRVRLRRERKARSPGWQSQLMQTVGELNGQQERLGRVQCMTE